jgi:hypothetical protein
MTNDQPQFRDFIKGYYKRMPNMPFDPAINAMQKADVPMTANASTTWFDPVYLGSLMLEGLTRSTKAFKVLTKTSYQQQGDSFQTISADVAATGYGSMLETATLYANTAVPALTDNDMIYPAVFHIDWTNTEVAAALSGIQRNRTTPSLEQIRDYMSKLFLDRLDMQICGVYNDFVAAGAGINPGYGVDSAATSAGAAQFESIDRMVSDHFESGGGANGSTNTYTTAATSGDIYWNYTGTSGGGTVRFDRSASTAESQLRLPTGGSAAAGEAYNIGDELDDLMAKCLVYAEEPYNYVALMSPKAYNKLKAENDPKALITDYTSAVQSVAGVSSTPGVVGGKVQLSAIRLSDITVPIVTVPYLMGTANSGWLWKNTKHTTGGPGHIYLINQNALEFRTLIPITYRSVQAENALETKHTLYMAGQLIAKNWMSHGKLCNIAT